MANTPVSIVNMGLSKIGQTLINSIQPPKTTTEKTVAMNYPQWRDSELALRRWVFATDIRTLTYSSQSTVAKDAQRPYAYELPADCLRVVREKTSLWMIRGRVLWSPYNSETVEMIVRKDEADFDPLFVEMLAARSAKELVEPITQSNEKWQKAQASYKEAKDNAQRLNAFELEPDDINQSDDDSDWLRARSQGPFA